jgi:anaerobic dimethyl sulfoxide reductase subunit B (iron-sulfur subunit)
MGEQVGLYINQQYCTGCKTCQIACKDKHDLDVGENLLLISEVSGGTFTPAGTVYIPDVWAYWVFSSCHHCDRPACVVACPTGAIFKNPGDGVVSVTQDICIGCRQCVRSCPYGAPQYVAGDKKVLTCDLCADYRAEGKDPSCVAACPLRVLQWGTVDDMKREHPEGVTSLHGLPDAAVTGPNTLYTPHRHALRDGAARVTESR